MMRPAVARAASTAAVARRQAASTARSSCTRRPSSSLTRTAAMSCSATRSLHSHAAARLAAASSSSAAATKTVPAPAQLVDGDMLEHQQASSSATSSSPTSSPSSTTLPSPSSASSSSSTPTVSSTEFTGDEMAKADVDARPSTLTGAPVADPFLTEPKNHFEIKDAELIFRTVWEQLKEKYGEENLRFPKEILWLAGAPGAGKGAMTNIVQSHRGITSPPIEVGALLTSPAAQAIKAQGKLVGDQMVMELLLDTLLRPEYATGVLVDGFPRTMVQAECIKLLFDAMQSLRAKYGNDPERAGFRRPVFHIIVMYIDKDESVRRQMRRGELAMAHNAMVQTTGIGKLKQVRETDLSPELAAERYRQFKEQVYESLKLVKEKFHFHFINAEGTPLEVQERIIKELSYQSSMELADVTYEQVRRVPLTSEVITNARHDLVKRLDGYLTHNPKLFAKVIDVINDELMHIIKRQALSGRAIVRSVNPIFAESGALDMALDVLCERGYVVTLDYNKHRQPVRVDLSSGEIIHEIQKVWQFEIEWQRPTIRRG